MGAGAPPDAEPPTPVLPDVGDEEPLRPLELARMTTDEFQRAREAARVSRSVKVGVKTAAVLEEEVLARLDASLNELYLMHGTTPEGALGISEDGFEMTKVGSHRGAMFGRGCYFAEMASKADESAGGKPDAQCSAAIPWHLGKLAEIQQTETACRGVCSFSVASLWTV